jgi:hypothetical protein
MSLNQEENRIAEQVKVGGFHEFPIVFFIHFP